jgi:hypothetical protein
VGWADAYIKALQRREVVSFRPRGHSMSPRIRDNQLVSLEPYRDDQTPVVGEIVLCQCGARQYLHLVKRAHFKDGFWTFLIGNNKGRLNGWVPRTQVYGRLLTVQD